MIVSPMARRLPDYRRVRVEERHERRDFPLAQAEIRHPRRVMRGEAGMDVGERVRVRLTRTNAAHGFINVEAA